MDLRRKLFESCWNDSQNLTMGVSVKHLNSDNNIPPEVVSDWEEQTVLPLTFDDSWPMDVECDSYAVTADIAFRRHSGALVARCKIAWSAIVYISTVFDAKKPGDPMSGRTLTNRRGTTLRLV